VVGIINNSYEGTKVQRYKLLRAHARLRAADE